MKIREAFPADAPLIAASIVEAVGREAVATFAGADRTVEEVAAMFEELARRDDTQYSYLNTLVATTDAGLAVGVAVAYDGAGLHPMRDHFFRAARERLGRDMTAMGDECSPGEYYLDTLAVLPEHRGQGYAKALIEATAKRAAAAGKPLGLLVEKGNDRARRLYLRCGFRQVGETPFAFILMDHLQRPLPTVEACQL